MPSCLALLGFTCPVTGGWRLAVGGDTEAAAQLHLAPSQDSPSAYHNQLRGSRDADTLVNFTSVTNHPCPANTISSQPAEEFAPSGTKSPVSARTAPKTQSCHRGQKSARTEAGQSPPTPSGDIQHSRSGWLTCTEYVHIGNGLGQCLTQFS